MKFTKLRLISAGLFLATIQIFMISASPQEEDVKATEDAYAAYQQYYQQYSEQQQQTHPQKPHPLQFLKTKFLKNKQDFGSDVSTFMSDTLGSDAATALSAAAIVLGGINLIALLVQQSEQSSICTSTKALGNTALTLTTSTTMPSTYGTGTSVITQLNLIENAINNIATPTCS